LMTKKVVKIASEGIQNLIYFIRGQKVMLDYELADLYGVPTKALKQAVKRNLDRFPSDFMFEFTKDEFADLRSQIVTSSSSQWGGPRYAPMAFTEQGVAMLSNVLRSKRAVQVNIETMRTFVKLRQMLATHKDLDRKLTALETKYDKQFRVVFDAIRALMKEEEKPKKKIGFEIKEPKRRYGKK
jgi:hypothetical protein